MEYQTLFYGGLAGAILSFIISIVMFIKLNISEVFEDLTGFSFHKWAKRPKGRSRSKLVQNNKPITREIQPRRDVELEIAAPGNVEATELLAADVSPSGSAEATELLRAEFFPSNSTESTELLFSEEAAAASADTTEHLAAANADETEPLAEDAAETELLSMEIGTTVLLNEEMEETTLLSEPAANSNFMIERDVLIVHTNATI